MKINKKGLEFKLFTYALAAFSMIIIASGVIIAQWNLGYNQNIGEDLEGLNKLSAVSEKVGLNKGRLSPTDSPSGEDPEVTTYRGVYGVIGTIFSSFSIVYGEGGIIGSIVERFGIPNYVYWFLIILIFAAMVWAVVSIIFRIGRGTA